MPLPIGIYNEVKDVGTVLPFYRPSGNFYGESTWMSDTVDGVVVSRTFARGSRWPVDFDLYFGEWTRIETDGNTLTFGESDIEDAVGFFVWFNTPVSGVRVGLGANRFHSWGGVFLPPGVTDTEKTRYLSFDGDFDLAVLRTEYSRRTFTGGHWDAYYAELQLRLSERWRLMGLYDVGDLRFKITFFATFDDRIEELRGVGVNLDLRANLVFKLEHHWITGYGQIEDVPLNIFFDDSVKVRLTILSVATAF